MKTDDFVQQARQRFDRILHTPEYHKVHSDAAHLEALIRLIDKQAGEHYLDLATGNGYVAFELAGRFPELRVTGVDIAAESIRTNQTLARERGLSNLDFHTCDGVSLPFNDRSLWGVVCRYAFHHFPEAQKTVKEIHRVLEPGGFAIISDPIPMTEDAGNFIDQFQKLKSDGHIHYYPPQELAELFHRAGFHVEKSFQTTVTYPRDLDENYLRLFERTPESILKKYHVDVSEAAVQITVDVQNAFFRRDA